MCVFLQNSKVVLRPLKETDLDKLAEMLNNPKIRGLIGEVFPYPPKAVSDYLQRCQSTNERIFLGIQDKQSGNLIGETGLLRIFYPWRCADYSLIIADKDYWGKGYGTAVTNLMFDYAFNQLGLNRLGIGVLETNKMALKFWQKVGFVQEGTQRQGGFANGRFYDFIMMSLLAGDYKNNVL